MKHGKWVLATGVLLAVAALGRAADPPKDDPTLTKEQNKFLKEFQTRLGAPPLNPNERGRYAQAVQESFNKLLSTTTQPSKQSTNLLATSLVQGLQDGTVSVQQSVALTKAMVKVLDLKTITYQDTNQLVRTIEPIVTNTGLRGTVKMRLYDDVLRVIRTAPTYSPR